MAISTYQAYLMRKSGDNWSKVCDIKSVPDLGGSPEMLETTTLSNKMKTYILGIQSLEALEFSANFDATDFTTISGYKTADLATPSEYAVCFGYEKVSSAHTYGKKGTFKVTGQIDVHTNGGGVNEVVEMTITIAPSTDITFNTTGVTASTGETA